MVECISCHGEMLETGGTKVEQGVTIQNHCIESLPPVIRVCKKCVEDFQIKLLTGRINPFALLKSLKGGKG